VNNYNRIASFYDLLVKIIYGNKLYNAKKHFLPAIKNGSHVLMIGGGTGDVLNELLQKPSITVDFIEPSSGMIRQAEKKLPPEYNSRVHFIRGTVESIPPGTVYDTVITSFVFDLFKEHDALAFGKTIYPYLKKGGTWLLTDFFKTKNMFQRFILWLMYRFFKITTKIGANDVPGYEKIFQELNLLKKEEYRVMNGFVKSILYIK